LNLSAIDLTGLLTSLLVAGGGGAIVAYSIFKTLGTGWLENKFAQRLENFRHEKAKEIERLRAEIDGSLKARIRHQEKEFETLSQCWHLMNIAYGAVTDFVSPFQQYQDINSMSANLRREFVEKLDVLPAQRSEILQSSNPFSTYKSIVHLIKNNLANRTVAEFNNCVYRLDIFMDLEISNDFKEVLRSLNSSIVSMEVGTEASDVKMKREAWQELKDKCAPMVDKLSKKLRSRVGGTSEP